LDFIHSKGFAHRDVKLENVSIDHNLKILLLDFGLSIELATLADPNIVKYRTGTMMYMAPEAGSPVQDGRKLDVFSLGVTLFTMYFQ
jgi:serine/threonine protein kinase